MPTRAPPESARYLVHGRHHVEIRASAPGLLARVAAYCERLIVPEPCGERAGAIRAWRAGSGSIAVEGGEPTSVEMYAHPGAAARAIVHRAIRALIAARPDLLWLHAAAMADAGGATLFAGGCGAGKSTLVAKMVARGWTYLSDEIAAIDPRDRTVHPFPLTPYRRIRAGDSALDDDAVRRMPKAPVPLDGVRVAAGPVTINRVFLLRFAAGATPPRVERCTPGEAVASLLSLTFGSPATREPELRGFARIVGDEPGAPVVRVEHASVREVVGALGLGYETPPGMVRSEPADASAADVVARLAGAAA